MEQQQLNLRKRTREENDKIQTEFEIWKQGLLEIRDRQELSKEVKIAELAKALRNVQVDRVKFLTEELNTVPPSLSWIVSHISRYLGSMTVGPRVKRPKTKKPYENCFRYAVRNLAHYIPGLPNDREALNQLYAILPQRIAPGLGQIDYNDIYLDEVRRRTENKELLKSLTLKPDLPRLPKDIRQHIYKIAKRNNSLSLPPVLGLGLGQDQTGGNQDQFKYNRDRHRDSPDSPLLNVVLPLLSKRFKFVKKLGSGNWGEVIKAKDLNKDRNVAIKYIKIDHPDDIYYANREAKILLHYLQEPLCHPNIMCMYEYRIKDNYMFIITEYIHGVRLSDLNNHSKMFTKNSNDELADFYFMCIQIFDALTFIHFHGIAHRDLHAENILLQNDRMRIKLIDFGLACKVPSIKNKIIDDIHHTPTIKCIKGGRTQLFYTAPELLKCHGSNSDFDMKLMISSDIWGLGLTLHQLIVNHFPITFPTGKNLTEKMINLLNSEFYIDPNEFYFSSIYDMISEMLQMDPKKRITAQQLQKLSITNWTDVLNKRPKDIMQSDIRPINHLWGDVGGYQFKSMKSKYRYENEHYKMLD